MLFPAGSLQDTIRRGRLRGIATMCRNTPKAIRHFSTGCVQLFFFSTALSAVVVTAYSLYVMKGFSRTFTCVRKYT